jgi:cytochrome P450
LAKLRTGEKHKRFRNSMGPAFNAPAINDLRPIFQSKADELRDRWEAQCLAAGGSAVVKGGEDIGLATVNVIGEGARPPVKSEWSYSLQA